MKRMTVLLSVAMAAALACPVFAQAPTAGYWKNGTWVRLSATGGMVTSLVVSGTDVYAAGWTLDGSKKPKAGYWKNEAWFPLSPDGVAHSLAVSGEDVYVGGRVGRAGLGNPGYWKNGTWVPLPHHAGSQGWVTSLVVSGSDVYAGGINGGPGYWENSTWVPLSSFGIVTSLVVSGSGVYAGGWSPDSSNRPIPGYWKDGTWVPLPRLSPAGSGFVGSLFVSGSDVYAAGYSSAAFSPASKAGLGDESPRLPGYWKNSDWLPLSQPAPLGGTVNSLVVSGADIYAAGWRKKSPEGTEPGYWMNGTWLSLSPLGVVTSLAVSGSDVYAAGAMGGALARSVQ